MAGKVHGHQAQLNAMDGPALQAAFASGVAWLGENKSAVDSLNVFPVPDGDTGTNMFLTVSAALKEAQKTNAREVGIVADAIALGSLMGARGNSGVIFSQLMRGFAKRLHGLNTATGSDVAAALVEAANMAYKAVMKPVEGTILTVARMGARAGVQAARNGADVIGVLDEAIKQGEITLGRTPEMLPALKEAGVVDAGGKGLLVFLSGFASSLKGKPMVAEASTMQVQKPAAPTVSSTAEARAAREDITFKYCTELIVKGSALDADKVKSAVFAAVEGDSALFVGNSDTVKVHIHTNFPGRVLETCISFGSLHDIDINNMEDQHNEFEAKAEAASSKAAVPYAPPKDLGIVAVAAGDGIQRIFESLGVDVVVTGGQTMNPSIQDIAQAARQANARNVIMLPNNGNVVLTAAKTVEVPDVADISIHVVPTKTIPQGIAALLALAPSASVEENVERMKAVAGNVKTGEVTYAVRDSSFNGMTIRENDVIGLFDGELKAVGAELEQVVGELFAAMHDDSDEFATVLYGSGVTADQAEALAGRLAQSYPDIEFEVQYGGQPLYYYLISME